METIDFSDNYYKSDLVMVVKKEVLMKMQLPFRIFLERKLQHN